MFIRCQVLPHAPTSSDVLLEINTIDGTEEVMVYQDTVGDGVLEIGKTLGTRDGYELVELPRESASGKWRVWVPSADVLQIS